MNHKLVEICDLYETWFEELKSGQQLSNSFIYGNQWKVNPLLKWWMPYKSTVWDYGRIYCKPMRIKTTLFEESSFY